MSNCEITLFFKNFALTFFDLQTYKFNSIKLNIFDMFKNRRIKIIKNDILISTITTTSLKNQARIRKKNY